LFLHKANLYLWCKTILIEVMSQAKGSRYQRIYQQIKELIVATDNIYSRMATINAVLHHKMKTFFWTGFYMLDGEELVVGPYQGSLACLKLKRHTGVCWSGVNSGKSVVVPDVHDFPGHIACSSLSNSEIVVPLIDPSGKVVGVFDVDSRDFNAFDEVDREWLEKIVDLVYLKI